jgi:hypothetical protein
MQTPQGYAYETSKIGLSLFSTQGHISRVPSRYVTLALLRPIHPFRGAV